MRANLIFIFVVSASVVQSQSLPEELIPPNGVELKGNIYIDKTEIANIHWLEFLHFIEKDSSQHYFERMQVDSTAWNTIDQFDKNWGHTWLHSPKFRYYPLVGVTREQVEEYNKWRSEAVNRNVMEDHKDLLEELGIVEITYTFRLPTPEEWEQAAYGQINPALMGYSAGVPVATLNFEVDSLSRKTIKTFFGDTLDFRKLKKDIKTFKKGTVVGFILQRNYPYFTTLGDMLPRSVNYGQSNDYGLKCMIGNIGEMVTKPNLIKGGSWLHPIEKARKGEGIYWDEEPKAWVGFRNVCEVRIKYFE